MSAAILTAVGAIGSLVLSVYGMSKQEEENAAVRAQSMRMRREDIQRAERIRKEDLQRAAKQERYMKSERRREWKWKEDDRNYNRYNDALNRFFGVLDREPAFRNQLLNIWGRR